MLPLALLVVGLAAEPKGYVCGRAASPPRIDGKLDDAAWNEAPWTDPFVDIEGDRRPRPRYRTRVKMLWDENYFYVAAEMEEPHVWATLKEHDSVIFQDNDFEIFIDPDGDNHEYYELEINAFNTEWDLRLVKPYRDGGPALNSWEIPGLKTAVHIDGSLNDPMDHDRGWSVEVAIPWKAFGEFAGRRAPPRDGAQWRVNFSRVEWTVDVEGKTYRKRAGRREDNWVWSPQGAIDMHKPELWGYVQFADGNANKTKFRPDPAWPARVALMRIYDAQKLRWKDTKTWAEDLNALKLGGDRWDGLTGRPTLRRTPDGFEAIVEVTRPGDGPKRWHIRQDSKLWAE
jgi:Carbohydrate family 9 binding domain-like